MYNVHPHISLNSHVYLALYLLYTWELVLAMYNAYPYFFLKNMGKKVCIIQVKIWYEAKCKELKGK